MKLKDVKKKLDEVQSKLDLKKRFPGYFNKWIFRGVVFSMILLLVVVFFSNDKTLVFVFAECDEDVPCVNPFYICPDNLDLTNPFLIEECIQKDFVPAKIQPLCDAGLCINKSLAPHQIIGNAPNYLAKNFNFISLLFVVLGFGINHLIWRRKQFLKQF